MKELKLFKSPIFGQVRTIVVNAQVLFAATDVAKCLGYANPKDAVIRHCKSDGVVFCDLIDTMGRNQKAKFITKGNVIRLVASSELPQAEKVESWIFDEVIPSVLETGGYIATKNDDTPEEIMARALTIAQATLEKREERLKQLEADNAAKDETISIQAEQIKESAPKVKVYNDYISSSGTYTATQIAKEYGWGAETLNRKLKEMGIQYKQNGQWLLYAKYDGNNYTRSIPRTYTKSDGVIGTQMQTVWTSKGREFIHEILPL
jgi:prophage antirepressor-like protein